MDTCTPKHVPALTNAAVAVKAGKGAVCWYDLFNPSAADAYVQIFDKAAADVAVGTDKPVLSIGIPAGGRASGTAESTGFLTAIAAAATTTVEGAIAPATAIAANFGVR